MSKSELAKQTMETTLDTQYWPKPLTPAAAALVQAVAEAIGETEGGTSDLTRSADGAISANRVLVEQADGTVAYADPTDLSHATILLGLSKNAAADAENVTIAPRGAVLDDALWSWTPTANLFLAADGFLSEVPPVSGFLCVVATALSATRILMRLEPPIFLP